MTDLSPEQYFYQILTSVYHFSLLVYDHAGDLLHKLSPFPEEDEVLLMVATSSERLLRLCQQSLKPQVISNELNQVWAGVPLVERELLKKLVVVGPVYSSEISEALIVDYARSNQLSTQSREKLLNVFKQTPIYPFIEFTRVVALLYAFMYNQEMDVSLLSTAGISPEVRATAGELRTYQKSEVYNTNTIHATYAFEQYMWQCIREGKLEKLKRHLLKTGTHGSIGPIGNNDPVRQQKNTFICAVTLATRAAIEGGLSPESAYSLSDLYIQQVEAMKDVLPIMTLSEMMLYDFTTRVSKQSFTSQYSKMVKDCCNYIDLHVREHLGVHDVAACTGLHADYVSKKFKEETGLSIGSYIKNAKVSEAKSLLKYSDLSLSEISELLSFSSQSFFTAIFRQMTGVTPKQYRLNPEA
jgi:YSIRK-targeted surface antigen transcriptional regulator